MDTIRGDPNSNFNKLVSHIDSHVIDHNHPLAIRTAVKLYLVSDTGEASDKTIKKRRQRLIKKRLDYYGEKILVFQTHTDISD